MGFDHMHVDHVVLLMSLSQFVRDYSRLLRLVDLELILSSSTQISIRLFFFYLSRTRMEKPWRSPPANGGPSSSASAALPMQMTSSTPLHFSPGITVSPASSTRMSLDLFHKNAFKYHMEQPSRPSLTTGWFSFSL